MMTNGDAHPLFRTIDIRQIALERLQVIARVLPKNRDEQIFLAVEVEVDRAVGDACGARDFRHLRVEVAALRKDVDRRAENALALSLGLGDFGFGWGGDVARHR